MGNSSSGSNDEGGKSSFLSTVGTFFSEIFGEPRGFGDVVVIGGRRFSIELRIGRGQLGDTFVLEDVQSGEGEKKRYAVKVYKKARLVKNASYVAMLESEKGHMAPLHSPFITNLLATDQDAMRLFAVYELSLGGDLETKLLYHRRLPERAVLQVAVAALLGLGYLHRAGIVHGDVKPSNVVVGKDGYCRLCDFGLSGPPVASGRRWGTVPYTAPETLSRGESTALSDMWSLAITLFELFWGVLPWDLGDTFAPGDDAAAAQSSSSSSTSPLQERYRRIASQIARVNGLGTPDPNHERIHFTWGIDDPTWSENFAALIARLTLADPAARLGADAALAQPFFAGVDVDKFTRREYQLSSFLRLRDDEYPFNMQHNLELDPRFTAADAISLSDQHRYFDQWNWARPTDPSDPHHFAHQPDAMAQLHRDPRFLSSSVEISLARDVEDLEHRHADHDDDDHVPQSVVVPPNFEAPQPPAQQPDVEAPQPPVQQLDVEAQPDTSSAPEQVDDV